MSTPLDDRIDRANRARRAGRLLALALAGAALVLASLLVAAWLGLLIRTFNLFA